MHTDRIMGSHELSIILKRIFTQTLHSDPKAVPHKGSIYISLPIDSNALNIHYTLEHLAKLNHLYTTHI